MGVPMVPGFRILSVGDDDHLRLSRDLILRNEGYEVESTTSNSVLKILPEGRFDVAVISQSVNLARAIRVAGALKKRDASIRILRIQELRSDLLKVFDVTCETLCGPSAFLRAVGSLCTRENAQPKA